MRIASLLPTATEMLYALGLGRSVVARSEHCTYPPHAAAKPIVVRSRVKRIARQDSLAIHKAVAKMREQGAHQFEVDGRALKRIRPDLVITQNLCSVCAASHPEVEEALEQVSPRPRVVTLQAQGFRQVLGEMTRLGEITGRQAAARRLVEGLERRLRRVRQLVAGAPARPRVWCCEWLEPPMASGHWVPEMVELAGGADGLGLPGKNSVWLSWEQVRRYDPGVILVMPCSYSIPQTLREKKRLTGRPGWEALSAVRAGRVHAVDGAFFHHAGPRLMDGIELLAHLLHPDRVPAGARRAAGAQGSSPRSSSMHLTAPPPFSRNSDTSTGKGITPSPETRSYSPCVDPSGRRRTCFRSPW